MKSRYLFFIILLIATSTQAQPKEAAVKPELINVIYLVGDSNQLTNLEKGKVSMENKAKLGGFGGASSSYVMDGSTSSTRIGNTHPQFAIKMSGMMMDPSQMIRLYKFKGKGKEREAAISKSGFMGKNSSMDQEGIAFSVKSSTEGVFIIIPEKNLEPGEYGFINMMMPTGSGRSMGYTVFAFGIDR